MHINHKRSTDLAAAYASARNFRKKSLFHQAIDVLSEQLADNPDNPELLNRIAENYETVQEYSAAAGYFEAASKKNKSAKTAFMAGWAFERSGNPVDAERMYAVARAIEKGEAARYGTGVFFQRKGLWPEAARCYERSLETSGPSADLCFRLAMAYDRQYEWARAAHYYRMSLELAPNHPYRYYRLGFVLERAGELGSAIEAYSIAVASGSARSSEWSYRIGACLFKSERFREASEYFMMAEPDLKADIFSEPHHPTTYKSDGMGLLESRLSGTTAVVRAVEAEQVGDLAFRIGRHELAARAFMMAVDAADDHSARLFYKLGCAWFKLRQFERAAQAFIQTRLHSGSHGVDVSSYMKDPGLKEVLTYTELMESLPIRDDVVLYESNHGDSIACNPLALFEIMSKSRPELWHVWTCNDVAKAPSAVRQNKRVIFVKKGSYGYLRHLASAKYLINNTSFPTYFIRRGDQKYLNTWHGTPLKTLGKDVRTGFFEHRNITRNLLQVSHLIAPNMHTAQTLIGKHEVTGLFTGKIAITGYPRVDRTLNASDTDVRRIRAQLGIKADDNRRVVLYAPTWRGGIGTSHFDTQQLKKDLEALQGTDRHVIFRAHRFAESVIISSGLKARVAPPSLDTNDLLSAVDVLVTDYSSIFFDFLPLNRPIVFYVPDLEQYSTERGLYFEMERMPGTMAGNTAELAWRLDEALAGRTVSRNLKEALDTFCPREDGKASERVIRFFLEDSTEHTVEQSKDPRVTILFRQSFIPNGITASFLSLVAEIDQSMYRTVVLFDANSIANDSERLRLFNSLPSHVLRIARSGRQLFQPEEKWLDGKFQTYGGLENAEQMTHIEAASKREFCRLFGEANFDILCEFDGYSKFWAGIMAFGGSPNARRNIYMHNELYSEHLMKHPALNGVFSMYRYFDSLISVSESVRDANQRALATRYGIKDDKFVYANNIISPAVIKTASTESVDADLLTWARNFDQLIVTMGRLSPEKGHERLIKQFARLSDRYPRSALIIIGEGGLRPELETLITDLGLNSRVWLHGHTANPFPIIRMADGFILPSLHEGQGLALLEALVLGVPVTATDIPGPRSLLGDDQGLLVANTEDGVRYGLDSLLAGDISASSFDSDRYVGDALKSFQEAFPPDFILQ